MLFNGQCPDSTGRGLRSLFPGIKGDRPIQIYNPATLALPTRENQVNRAIRAVQDKYIKYL